MAVRRRLRKIGCGCAGLLVLAGAAAIPLARQQRLRNHAALARAVEYLADQDETAQAVGSGPVVSGWITAKISEWPSRGDADLVFTLRGPKGRAIARVELVKSLGEWGVESAGLIPEGQPMIDLSPEQPDFGPAPEAPPEKTPV